LGLKTKFVDSPENPKAGRSKETVTGKVE